MDCDTTQPETDLQDTFYQFCNTIRHSNSLSEWLEWLEGLADTETLSVCAATYAQQVEGGVRLA